MKRRHHFTPNAVFSRLQFTSNMRHNGSMGLVEAGAYLHEVRMLQKLPRHYVAAQIGVSEDRITQLEMGRAKLNGPALLRLIRTIGASYEEVTAFLDDGSATIGSAQELARQWIARKTAEDVPDSTEAALDDLFAIALQRTGGDRRKARELLLQVLNDSFEE